MAFIRGKALLPEDTPLAQKNPWEYISVIYEDNRKESMIPLSDARVEVFFPYSRDLVSRGLTSEDGEFFVRVPGGEHYFVEISVADTIVLLAYIKVDWEGETDVGLLDSLTTSYALYVLRHISLGGGVIHTETFEADDFQTLRNDVERCWREGRGLESLEGFYDRDRPEPASLKVLDPFGFLRSCRFETDPLRKNLMCEWESTVPGQVTLCTRSYRSRHFRRKASTLRGTGGRLTVSVPGEFEGYVYFLEFENNQGLLGRTPLYALRTSLQPISRKTLMVGRQEGPAVVSRQEKSGEERVPGTHGPLSLNLHNALEKQFEVEIDLEFSRKIRIPRYLVREGLQDLELTIYLPQEHSFLWGPVGDSPGVELARSSLAGLARQWRMLTVDIIPESIVEIGFSTPFAELVAYRESESYRLFSDTELQHPLTILSFRKTDSLDLESTIYYRGTLLLSGEGLFQDYRMRVDLEGKFEEDQGEGFFAAIPGEVSGNIECRVEYWIEPNPEK